MTIPTGLPDRLVLASASPRRRQLLETIGLEVEVRPVSVHETVRPGETGVDAAERLAREKAEAAACSDGEVLVAADTLVVLDGESMGKPADDAEARAFLERLSGRTHEVVTGYCVRRGDRLATDHVTTRVRFRDLDGPTIDAYVASGESADKAGAYGIQGRGAALVESLEGSYSNVVGLPLTEVLAELRGQAP